MQKKIENRRIRTLATPSEEKYGSQSTSRTCLGSNLQKEQGEARRANTSIGIPLAHGWIVSRLWRTACGHTCWRQRRVGDRGQGVRRGLGRRRGGGLSRLPNRPPLPALLLRPNQARLGRQRAKPCRRAGKPNQSRAPSFSPKLQ